MSKGLTAALLDLRELDRLAGLGSDLHRLDPRVKVLTLGAHLACLASFPANGLAELFAFTLFPVFLIVGGKLPAAFVLKKAALGLPFVICLALANPFLDRSPALSLGPVQLSGGWVSFFSLVLRGALGLVTAVAVTAVTGPAQLGSALARLGLPRVFAQQLAFLHRYLFVVGEEAQSLARARSLRANGQSLSMHEFRALSGHLLLRSWERAERIHQAMASRGFDGSLPQGDPHPLNARDWRFLIAWTALPLGARLLSPVHRLGALLLGGNP